MSACTQPGCAGVIEDGYCNVCGMAGGAAAGPAGPTAAAAPANTATTASTRTSTGSTRTGSGKVPMTRSQRSTRSTRSTRSGSIRSGRSTTRALGSRPLARPPLPALDPLAAIVPGVVPERKRYCSNCDAQLKRDSGFCPKCGQEYSFIPSLQPGDMVADKYEIKGTIAFGGLGWIYLALDTVLTRWVTMKGLLNSKDPRMLEVAIKEREDLAAVKHPNIVGIYDFITHNGEGYIVMEYVNGKTLMSLRKEHGEPLPAAEAISYIIEILPAFQYLDDMGFIYCDFKPENVMVEEETVKLIDMGAVRHVGETGGDVYGSKGYTAPEASDNPTALSDLYTVARALAVLVASFDFQGKYEHSIPPPDEVPVFAQHEALHRFLVKATRAKPEERFQTATEMAEQLTGVLRTVVADTADLGPAESAIFAPDSDRSGDAGAGGGSEGVPKLRVDAGDAAANVILAAGAVPDAERRHAMFQRALKQYPDSLELKLRSIDELVSMGRFIDAELAMADVQSASPSEWRLAWYRGRALLAQGKTTETLAAFRAMVDELPGELAPKHALGLAYEAQGSLDDAIRYYDAVSRADANFVSAALRLARCLEKKGDRAGAVAAYRRVSSSSSRFGQAQMELARLLITPAAGKGAPSLDDLVAASEAVQSLDGLLDGLEVSRLKADLYTVAVRCASGTSGLPADVKILGVALHEKDLRTAAEGAFRTCARQAKTDDARFELIDRANQVRPLTWT
jgi:serine/threonine-protein kinase PknG